MLYHTQLYTTRSRYSVRKEQQLTALLSRFAQVSILVVSSS